MNGDMMIDSMVAMTTKKIFITCEDDAEGDIYHATYRTYTNFTVVEIS